VRRVGIGAGEQLVEAALRIRFRSRNAQAKLPEAWRPDRDKQRCDGLSMLPQVIESRRDQVATRKIGRSRETHGRDIAADPRVRDLRLRGSLPCVAATLGFQTGRRGTTYDFITLKSEYYTPVVLCLVMKKGVYSSLPGNDCRSRVIICRSTGFRALFTVAAGKAGVGERPSTRPSRVRLLLGILYFSSSLTALQALP
jgi:hypothetical protein